MSKGMKDKECMVTVKGKSVPGVTDWSVKTPSQDRAVSLENREKAREARTHEPNQKSLGYEFTEAYKAKLWGLRDCDRDFLFYALWKSTGRFEIEE